MQKLLETKKVWIHTYNGHEVDLLKPSVHDIDAIDIAHSLAYLNRFTGHAVTAWSVAQHSVVGSILAEIMYPAVKWLPEEFLMHDSPEAYVGDVSSPLKSVLPGYREIEDRFRKCIEAKFAVSMGGFWEKKIDLRMLATERHLFMPEGGTPWSVDEEPFTYEEFMASLQGEQLKTHGGLWDYLWTPWPAEVAETNFLDRMEKLGI